jgi:hypothetical protein
MTSVGKSPRGQRLNDAMNPYLEAPSQQGSSTVFGPTDGHGHADDGVDDDTYLAAAEELFRTVDARQDHYRRLIVDVVRLNGGLQEIRQRKRLQDKKKQGKDGKAGTNDTAAEDDAEDENERAPTPRGLSSLLLPPRPDGQPPESPGSRAKRLAMYALAPFFGVMRGQGRTQPAVLPPHQRGLHPDKRRGGGGGDRGGGVGAAAGTAGVSGSAADPLGGGPLPPVPRLGMQKKERREWWGRGSDPGARVDSWHEGYEAVAAIRPGSPLSAPSGLPPDSDLLRALIPKRVTPSAAGSRASSRAISSRNASQDTSRNPSRSARFASHLNSTRYLSYDGDTDDDGDDHNDENANGIGGSTSGGAPEDAMATDPVVRSMARVRALGSVSKLRALGSSTRTLKVSSERAAGSVRSMESSLTLDRAVLVTIAARRFRGAVPAKAIESAESLASIASNDADMLSTQSLPYPAASSSASAAAAAATAVKSTSSVSALRQPLPAAAATGTTSTSSTMSTSMSISAAASKVENSQLRQRQQQQQQMQQQMQLSRGGRGASRTARNDRGRDNGGSGIGTGIGTDIGTSSLLSPSTPRQQFPVDRQHSGSRRQTDAATTRRAGTSRLDHPSPRGRGGNYRDDNIDNFDDNDDDDRFLAGGYRHARFATPRAGAGYGGGTSHGSGRRTLVSAGGSSVTSSLPSPTPPRPLELIPLPARYKVERGTVPPLRARMESGSLSDKIRSTPGRK